MSQRPINGPCTLLAAVAAAVSVATVSAVAAISTVVAVFMTIL